MVKPHPHACFGDCIDDPGGRQFRRVVLDVQPQVAVSVAILDETLFLSCRIQTKWSLPASEVRVPKGPSSPQSLRAWRVRIINRFPVIIPPSRSTGDDPTHASAVLM